MSDHERSAASPPRILNVDDDPASLYARSHILRKAGFVVEEASTGREALSRVVSGRPSLVLLDVKLPDASGFEICRHIKRDHPDVLILQHSAAFTRGLDRARGLQGGADGYLVAPLEPDELVANVNALLRLKRAEEDARRLAREAQDAKRTLDALMTYVPTGITIADAPDVTIRRVSDYGLALTQRNRDVLETIPAEAHPNAWQICYPDGTPLCSTDQLPLTRATKNGDVVKNEEWLIRRQDGTTIALLCSAGPIRGEDGQITGGIIAWHDIDELKRTEAALRASEARFQLAQSAAGIDTWEMGIGTNDVVWSPQQYELFGVDPAVFTPNFEGFVALIHEEDRARVLAENAAAIEERRLFNCEFRIRRPDGAVRWLLGRGVLRLDPGDRPVRMIGINMDVTERRAAEEALRQAKDEADAATRAKGRALAAVAHDLKQPLHVISGTLELLQLRNAIADPAAARRVLARVEQMNGALDMLMEAARIDSGVIKATFEVFPIQLVLDEAAETFSLSARARNLDLRVMPCSRLVRSDRRMLGRILQNLVGNAVKYTEHGGILIGCRRRGATLWLQVIDTGTGIPADRTDLIFEEFLRLDHEHGSGMGLGLSIVKRTADLLGHDLKVRSVPGKGSLFAIGMPLVS